MKRKYIFPLVASVLSLGACDYVEDDFDGSEKFDRPTYVLKKDYTLAEADYTKIGAYKAATIFSYSGKDLTGDEKEAYLKEVNSDLAAAKTENALADQATDVISFFLKETWFSADNGSAIKVTYNKKATATATENALNAATIYKVSNADYEQTWGTAFNFFTPTEPASKHVPGFLKTAYPEAATGQVALVDYNYSAQEPAGSATAIAETFEGLWEGTVNTAAIEGWTNLTTKGTYSWQGRIFSNNNYLQQSAYNHTGELETYMITPKLSIVEGMNLTFDACYGKYVAAGGRLTLLYSENLNGDTKEAVEAATWKDITSAVNIPVPTGTYGTLENVCTYDLSALAGKKIRIAFRYNGDGSTGATTTIQLDNVVVKSEGSGEGENTFEAMAGLFRFDGSDWKSFNDAVVLSLADYKAMGGRYDNFSSSMAPADYLPTYLKLKYPYAQEEAKQTVAYKYYNGKNTTVNCSSYIYTAGSWQSAAVEVTTDQFVLSNGKWSFDPSTVINLPVERGNVEVSAFYQTITDWVKANHPTYVTGYGNNDYYYGGSAYQNNVDFRLSAWKGQGTYEGVSDDELKALMWERLPEAFTRALEVLYATVAPIEGIHVIYTVNFGIYAADGVTTTNTNWTIQYEVVEKGKFEFVPESLKEVK